MILNIDIQVSYKTIEKYLSTNKCVRDNMFEKMLNIKQYPNCILQNDIFNNSQHKFVTLNEIQIGDIVKLTYIPDSQQYIELFCEYEYIGCVFFIDYENDNAFLYIDKYDKSTNIITRVVFSAEKNYCSYYGITRGYSIFFQKIN